MDAERGPRGRSKPEKSKGAWKLLPDVWELIEPRKAILALGFGLMLINRVAGLVLPGSTKFLIDNVIGKHQRQLLLPIILAVVCATLVQGVTSYALTQLLSKSSQRMISDLRIKVQAHIGRLPVSFYDANKTGVLVSRIMSDVEGVRNLIGTGLIEFAGGIMTSIFALIVLLQISFEHDGCRSGCADRIRYLAEQSLQNHPAPFPRAPEVKRGSDRAASPNPLAAFAW